MDMKKIMHDTMILFVICIISGLLLGLAHEVTYPITAARKAEEKAQSYRDIYVDADHFQDEERVQAFVENQAEILSAAGISGATINDCMTVFDGSDNIIGYALSVSTSGKVGEMVTAVCYSTDGTLIGIKILESSETAGLGSKAEEPAFTDQFAGKAVEAFKTVKGSASADGEIEAISGATITTDAVVLAANAGIAFAEYCAAN
jgi:electron transport complex protein RnfG